MALECTLLSGPDRKEWQCMFVQSWLSKGGCNLVLGSIGNMHHGHAKVCTCSGWRTLQSGWNAPPAVVIFAGAQQVWRFHTASRHVQRQPTTVPSCFILVGKAPCIFIDEAAG